MPETHTMRRFSFRRFSRFFFFYEFSTSYNKQGSTDRDQDPEKSRTGPNQDQQNFENLGPIRTGRSPDLAVREFLITSNQRIDVIDSMMRMDVGDEKYWWQFWNDGDSFGLFMQASETMMQKLLPSS